MLLEQESSARVLQVLLTACFQGYSFQFVFQLVFLAYTLQIPSICVLLTAFKTFCWNKLGILIGTSWHFSDISSDMYASWAQESTTKAPHLMSILPFECLSCSACGSKKQDAGMLTGNAKRTFCDNVCFGTSKSCSNRSIIGVICQGASSAPHFRLQGHSFQFVFQLVFLPHLTASLYLSRNYVRTSADFSL